MNKKTIRKSHGAAMCGYASPLYAESLSEFGKPFELPKAGGWLIERKIPDSPCSDAMGCYPLFSCKDWSKLHEDLERISNKLLSVAIVADPFGDYDPDYLKQCFKDVTIPFKEHFVVDLGRPVESFASKHHKYYARKAIREIHVEKCETSENLLDDWVCLYANLIQRHEIMNISAFSERAFKIQFSVPGLEVFRAVYENTTVGMILWYVNGDTGYWHLGAFTDVGYKLNASYAVMKHSIDYFYAIGLRRLLLGGGSGVRGCGDDGLSRFKKGWSTGTKTAYFCGRIFDHVKYNEIVRAKKITGLDYFPAYRKGEFS